eukprot:gb/GECG01001316.1/.p1 GENE.gb/GECG01001316.1/~~gb/GECG01001316.1/.p1  ORF type:complete len:272 (+),score=23.98 gb/GECG01001316.1/:1-816(+)
MVSPEERHLVHQTPFPAFAVEFNPFDDKRIAVTSCQHFGIIGNGLLEVIEQAGSPAVFSKTRECKTSEGLFDCAWSECNPHQIVGASGDGTIKLFDLRAEDALPVAKWSEHTQEVNSVDWNVVNKHSFISSSWDGSVKVWNVTRSSSESTVHPPRQVQCHSAVWHPSNPGLLLSTFADGSFSMADLRQPQNARTGSTQTELTSADWDKYNQHQFATGSATGSIYLWDLRNVNSPLDEIHGKPTTIVTITIWLPCKQDGLIVAQLTDILFGN